MELSMISKKCQECEFVEGCPNKRMEALAQVKEKPFERGMRATMNIVIDGNASTVYKSEIEKQLQKCLENNLCTQFDFFGRD